MMASYAIFQIIIIMPTTQYPVHRSYLEFHQYKFLNNLYNFQISVGEVQNKANLNLNLKVSN